MDEDMFVYKSHCELIITSDSVSPDEISRELGIVPHRQFNKGDEFTSKHSPRIGKKSHNLWAVRSESILSNDEDVNGHIEYLKMLLKEKQEVLKEYKRNAALIVVVWFWIETQLTEKDLSFINYVANSVRFSIITNTDISESESYITQKNDEF